MDFRDVQKSERNEGRKYWETKKKVIERKKKKNVHVRESDKERRVNLISQK